MAAENKKALTRRNVEFMKRCADEKLKKGKESVRGSPWVGKLPKDELKTLMTLVFNYKDWTPQTDPTGTKAAGVVQYQGHCVPWVIAEMDVSPPGILMMPPPTELVLLIKHSSEIR